MKLCLGLLDNSPPHQTRVFGEIDGKLIDLRLAYATLLIETGEKESAYEIAAYEMRVCEMQVYGDACL